MTNEEKAQEIVKRNSWGGKPDELHVDPRVLIPAIAAALEEKERLETTVRLVWAALGVDNYEQAHGKSIVELVVSLRETAKKMAHALKYRHWTLIQINPDIVSCRGCSARNAKPELIVHDPNCIVLVTHQFLETTP